MAIALLLERAALLASPAAERLDAAAAAEIILSVFSFLFLLRPSRLLVFRVGFVLFLFLFLFVFDSLFRSE
jgi:hypothetical protein